MDGTISMRIWAALIRINGLLIKKESMRLRERDGPIGPKRSWRLKQMKYNHISSYRVWNYQKLIFKQWDFPFINCGSSVCWNSRLQNTLSHGKGQTSAPTHVGTSPARAVRAERCTDMYSVILLQGSPGLTNHLITNAFCKKFLERLQADKSGSLLRKWHRTRCGIGIKNSCNLLQKSIFLLIISLKLS